MKREQDWGRQGRKQGQATNLKAGDTRTHTDRGEQVSNTKQRQRVSTNQEEKKNRERHLNRQTLT